VFAKALDDDEKFTVKFNFDPPEDAYRAGMVKHGYSLLHKK
jgi:hypothetical protein